MTETHQMSKTLSTFKLRQAGQSPWLDQISRLLLRSGKLKSMIRQSGLLGITSNPTIFEKAIAQPKGGYEKDIRAFVRRGLSTFEIYDALTIADIRDTCDLFLPVFRESKGEHGFVSLEVAPGLARETAKTVSEAKRLFQAVGRPNVMIKVPATPEGIPAVRELIGSGVNINITLMFSLKHYQDVAAAYLAGLEDFRTKGGELRKVFSVASVFVSRIDTLIDKKIEEMSAATQDAAKQVVLSGLKGKAAVANSKMIYQEFKKILAADRFRSLQDSGANIQKVLWGSTSTKNPAYPDLIYVEPLIGPETVNTMPQATFEAFLDHGKVAGSTIEEGLDDSRRVVSALKELGIDLNETGEKLQKEGVRLFCDSFDSLMRTLELARETYAGGKKKDSAARVSYSLDKNTQSQLRETLERLEKENLHSRLMKADPSLWKMEAGHQKVISNRMGWLNVAEGMLGRLTEIDELAKEAREEKIKDIVLLGMGGSSLAPEVLHSICKARPNSPRFRILDTTDASAIGKLSKELNLKSTWFVVASKSGSTIETLSQFQYFYDRVCAVYAKKDTEKAGRPFIAITDAGSSLEKLARQKHFRKTFINPSDIGGRYSALSFFGMVPAALAGLDIRAILRSARRFLSKTKQAGVLGRNPGLYLGIVLGLLARQGRDKLILGTSRSLSSFGAWLEQLIAESTGKEGRGIVPVDGELPAAPPSGAEDDKVYVLLKRKNENAGALDPLARAVKGARRPLIQIEWPDADAIGAEFLRWEIAAAAAGVILQINPFDEPNVKESKDNAARLLAELKAKGRLEPPKSLVRADSSVRFGDFFARAEKGSYLAILAYAERSAAFEKALARIRTKISQGLHIPVLIGFGPRYLHSIGQLYKGGAAKGLFIELLASEARDIPIPEAGYSFGQLKRAQAFGDIEALEGRGLPVLAVDIGREGKDLARFEMQLDRYLASAKGSSSKTKNSSR